MIRINELTFFNYFIPFLKSDPAGRINSFFFNLFFRIKYLDFDLFTNNSAFSTGIIVSNGFWTIAPVITSIAEYLGIFLIYGLSPAAKVLIILNFFGFLMFSEFVSLEFIA